MGKKKDGATINTMRKPPRAWADHRGHKKDYRRYRTECNEKEKKLPNKLKILVDVLRRCK